MATSFFYVESSCRQIQPIGSKWGICDAMPLGSLHVRSLLSPWLRFKWQNGRGKKRYTSFITVIYFLKYVSRNEGRAVFKHFSNIFLNKKMNCPRSFKMFIGEYLVPSGLWHSWTYNDGCFSCLKYLEACRNHNFERRGLMFHLHLLVYKEGTFFSFTL